MGVSKLTNKTRVVNKYHKVPYDVYIGRGSIFGNPFSHMPNTKAEFTVGTREQAVSEYEKWVVNQPEIMAKIPSLKGKTLCCFCAPLSCHGDVLAKLADET